MHWVGLQQRAAITGLVCLGGLESALRGSIFLAVERLVGQGVRLAGGAPLGLPAFPACSASPLRFYSAPYSPFPSSWRCLPKAGEQYTLQKNFFISFPNFSRCQEGAGETLQLQRGKEEGTCSKAFPHSPVVEKRDS